MAGFFSSVLILPHLLCFFLYKNVSLCHFRSVIPLIQKEKKIPQTLRGFKITVSLLISPVCMCSFVSFLTAPVLGFLQLAVLHLLCFPWRRQILSLLFSTISCTPEGLTPSACRPALHGSVLLSWWEVWEALNHPATYCFLQLSPQQICGLSLQKGVMAVRSFKVREWGWAFCPHPLTRTDISLLSSCSGFHLLQGLLVRLFPHLLSRLQCWRTRHCADLGN